jgi:hypothetical protein
MMCGGGVNAPESLPLQCDQGEGLPGSAAWVRTVRTVYSTYQSNGCYNAEGEEQQRRPAVNSHSSNLITMPRNGFVSAPNP